MTNPPRLATQIDARRRAFTLVACAWVAAVFYLITVASAGPASAHAQLTSTSPSNGQVVTQAPTAVTLTFDEPVQAYDQAIKVFAPDGQLVAAGGQARDNTVSLELTDDLSNGSYVVSWRVTSSDSHVISGGFTFSIGEASTTATQADTGQADTDVSLRIALYALQAISYAAVLIVAGLAIFQVFVLPRNLTRPLEKIRKLITQTSIVGIGALILGLPLASAVLTSGSLTALARWETWTDQLISDLSLAALLACLGMIVCVLAAHRSRTPISTTAMIVGASLAVDSFTLMGHTRTRGSTWLMVVMDLLHLCTAAVWLGGLVGLILVLWRSKSKARTDNATLAALTLARFSVLASALVALLSIAGVIMAWQVLGSFDALFSTSYGIVLLIKIGFALLTVCVAAWNRLWLLPRVQRSVKDTATWQLIRRAVSTEVALLLCVLVATAVMVDQNPNVEESAQQSTSQIQKQLGSTTIRMTVTPSRVGTNAMEFSLVDDAGKPVTPVDIPSLQIALPSMDISPLERTVTKTGPGTYLSNSDFPLPGEWDAIISIRLSKYENPVARIKVEVSE